MQSAMETSTNFSKSWMRQRKQESKIKKIFKFKFWKF
jgi:hypothetical protein